MWVGRVLLGLAYPLTQEEINHPCAAVVVSPDVASAADGYEVCRGIVFLDVIDMVGDSGRIATDLASITVTFKDLFS